MKTIQFNTLCILKHNSMPTDYVLYFHQESSQSSSLFLREQTVMYWQVNSLLVVEMTCHR